MGVAATLGLLLGLDEAALGVLGFAVGVQLSATRDPPGSAVIRHGLQRAPPGKPVLHARTKAQDVQSSLQIPCFRA